LIGYEMGIEGCFGSKGGVGDEGEEEDGFAIRI
jgi:hypothetical protein